MPHRSIKTKFSVETTITLKDIKLRLQHVWTVSGQFHQVVTSIFQQLEKKNQYKLIQLLELSTQLPLIYPFPLFFFTFGLDFEFDGSLGPLPTVALRTIIIVSTTIPPLSGSRMLSAFAIASRVVYSHGLPPWLSTCDKNICMLKQITLYVHLLIDTLKQKEQTNEYKVRLVAKFFKIWASWQIHAGIIPYGCCTTSVW